MGAQQFSVGGGGVSLLVRGQGFREEGCMNKSYFFVAIGSQKTVALSVRENQVGKIRDPWV